MKCMEAMSVRERFRAVLNFQPVDRLPIFEWAGWWNLTLERWRREGLSVAEHDPVALAEHFGLDPHLQYWVGTSLAGLPAPAYHGGPVMHNMDDYLKALPWLYPPIQTETWRQIAAKRRDGAAVLWLTFEGFFWFPRRLLGIEPHLYAFYDQPELMHRIHADLTQWMLRSLEEICAIAVPDFMTFAEDLSYNHGPMLSGAQFDEFLLPYYQQVIPRLHDAGVLAVVDSDGDVTRALPWFAAAGLDGVLPLERQAGVDIGKLRALAPRMRFIGHYDKMVMNQGEAALRREFERLMPTARQGGFIISCDHQTPPGVSYQDYLLYLRLFREYAGNVA